MTEQPDKLPRGDALLEWLDNRPRVGVEVGVQRGELSAYLLRHRRNLHLILVDPWRKPEPGDRYAASGDPMAERDQAEFDADMDAAMAAARPWMQQRTVFRASSAQAAEWLTHRQLDFAFLDFAFLDGDHGEEAVREDLAIWEQRLKPGGLLCGHDYGTTVDAWTFGVKPAVDAWAEQRGVQIETGADYTWFARVP